VDGFGQITTAFWAASYEFPFELKGHESPSGLWELCETPTGVLQAAVEKLSLVFPWRRQFPSGHPLLSFWFLFVLCVSIESSW
jgi:membrane-associated phospholipid phosphatase